MSKEFKEYRLEDLLIDSQAGFARKPIKSGEVIQLRTNNISPDGMLDFSELKHISASSKEIEKYSLKEGDILFNNTNSDIWVGKTAYIDRPLNFLYSNHLTRLRVDRTKVCPEYLAIYLHKLQREGYFKYVSTRWVNQTAVNTTALRRLLVRIPSIEIQRSTVAVINQTKSLRQRRVQANQLSNKLLLAVFMQMFGKKKPNNVVGDIAEFVSSGSTPLGGQKTYLSSGIMFIRSQNVQMNEFKLDDVAYISEETHEKMKRTWLKNNDVLLNITGASLGRVAVYRGDDNKANVNQHVCIIRVNKLKALPEYVSYYLSMPSAQREIWTSQAGASRQALNFQQVKKLKLLLPTIEEQRSFVNFMNIVSKIKENQQRSSREIESLFGTLLSEALSGSIK